MSAEIRTLPVEHRETFQPNKELVTELEALLAFAKEGKLQGCAWAVVYTDGSVPDGETANGWIMSSGTRFALTHSIACLQWRYHHEHYQQTGV